MPRRGRHKHCSVLHRDAACASLRITGHDMQQRERLQKACLRNTLINYHREYMLMSSKHAISTSWLHCGMYMYICVTCHAEGRPRARPRTLTRGLQQRTLHHALNAAIAQPCSSTAVRASCSRRHACIGMHVTSRPPRPGRHNEVHCIHAVHYSYVGQLTNETDTRQECT